MLRYFPKNSQTLTQCRKSSIVHVINDELVINDPVNVTRYESFEKFDAK